MTARELLGMALAVAAVAVVAMLRELSHEWRRRLHVTDESEER